MRKSLTRGFFAVPAVALAIGLLASPAIAQKRGGSQDPDENTRQVGSRPAGWTGRTDKPPAILSNANITSMDGGIHVVTGPAVTLWNPANIASGTYTISATFAATRIRPGDALGLFWGGKDLDSDKVTYGYFVVYGDGSFAIKHRANATDVHGIVDNKNNVSPAVHAADAAGKAVNALEIRIAADSVRFWANGKQLHAIAAAAPMVSTSGIYGLRVAHNIDVHVAGFGKK